MSEKTKEKVEIKDKENIKVKSAPEKEISQEEEKPEVSAPSGDGDTPMQIMSETDSLVSNLVKEAPTALPTVNQMSGKRPNLLALPDECDKLHGKKYRFRWLANDKRLRSKLQSSIWVLCTKLNCPFIKPERFKAHGAIEQSGMLLVFASEEAAKIRELEPAKKSADLVKHYTKDIHERDEFYKPESTGGDEEEGLTEGEDF